MDKAPPSGQGRSMARQTATAERLTRIARREGACFATAPE